MLSIAPTDTGFTAFMCSSACELYSHHLQGEGFCSLWATLDSYTCAHVAAVVQGRY